MANTKCEGCGEQHNARKAADGERLARRVQLASNGQTCAEVSRGSDGQARAALRASEGARGEHASAQCKRAGARWMKASRSKLRQRQPCRG